MKVRFAVSAGGGQPDASELKDFVTGAEQLGFDTLWFSDLPMLPSTDPLLAVAMAAAWTTRIKLGVNLVPFGYEPFVFARQVAQLDRLSEGRLLLTLVPGLDQPGERQALGIGGAHRGKLLDELIPELRALWSGAEHSSEVPRLPVLPIQDPLEVWLGGSGPEALVRAGRLADGWLGSLMTPARAAGTKARIDAEAAAAGRTVDPEHFGLSIAYAREPGDFERTVPIRRRPAVDLAEVVPVGRNALRDLVGRLVEAGLSKFVVRRIAPAGAWSEELDWLAGTVLDLQT